jgi:hypothetical protein
MARLFQIWGKAEGQAAYDKLIADGWIPGHRGELTVVFHKDLPVGQENSCKPKQ